jgi:hypothetical protein
MTLLRTVSKVGKENRGSVGNDSVFTNLMSAMKEHFSLLFGITKHQVFANWPSAPHGVKKPSRNKDRSIFAVSAGNLRNPSGDRFDVCSLSDGGTNRSHTALGTSHEPRSPKPLFNMVSDTSDWNKSG